MLCPYCRIGTKVSFISTHKSPLSIGLLRSSIFQKIRIVNIRLVQCVNCHLIFNQNFLQKEINLIYKSPRYFVKKYLGQKQKSLESSAINQIDKLLNKDSEWLEIGSGDNSLATMLSKKIKKIYTIDPNRYTNSFDSKKHSHIQGYFHKNYYKNLKFDGIILSHVLEHSSNLKKFISHIKACLSDNGYLYIEVPNFDEICKHDRFVDIFNDHINYFTKNYLLSVFLANNFTPIKTSLTLKKQHLSILFKYNLKKRKKNNFQKNNFQKLDFTNVFTPSEVKLRKILKNILNDNDSIAIWGAGAHANALSSFVSSNFSKNDCKKFKIAIDIDKSKSGKYLSNLPAKITLPNYANNYKVIIIASALHEDFIFNSIAKNKMANKVIKMQKKITLIDLS